MSVELITYGSDRRLELGAAEAIRAPIYLDDWTRIRIGLQFSMDGIASNIFGSPFFAAGVCNGSANVLAASTSDHVVAVRPADSSAVPVPTWTRTAGPPSYFTLNNGWYAFKRVGSTVSDGIHISGSTVYANNDTSQRSGWFIDIIKGSPNFTFQVGGPASVAGVQSDLTDTEFSAIMDLPNLDAIASTKTNYGELGPGGALAVDEVSDGALDHLFVYWDRTTHKFSFNIRHRKIS